MTGLDCNILVQLAMADHPAHVATKATVHDEIAQDRRLVLASIVVTEFLHVVTDPRRFAPPLAMAEALSWIEEFSSNPQVISLEPAQAALPQMVSWMRQHKLGRKRILDTHLAATLHAYGARRLLTSNPGDFEIFGAFELITP